MNTEPSAFVRRTVFRAALLLALAGTVIGTAWATGLSDKKLADKKAEAPSVGSAAEREATAIALVSEHHPELVELLERLRDNNPIEYQRAIRELARTSDRLANLKQKDTQRYALELEAWKLKSHIQLLSARASMSPNDESTAELRAALERQLDVRRRQLELDRADLTERLERTEATLAELDNDPQRQIDKQLQSLLRGIDDTRARAANQRTSQPSKKDAQPTRGKKKDAPKGKAK